MGVDLATQQEYSVVILAAFLMVMEYFFIMEITCNINRKRHFPKIFLEKHFGEQHQEAFGVEIRGGGYPDHGSGRYGQKLNYKQWVQFANSQRSYYNFLEQIFCILLFLFLGGAVYPKAAAIEAGIYMVCRLLYAVGYNSNSGATGRKFGAVLGFATQFALFVTAAMAASSLTQIQ